MHRLPEAVARGGLALAVAAAVTTAALPVARADEVVRRPALDVSVVLAGGLVFILGEAVFKDQISPDACRWCGSNPLDRGIRAGLRWDRPERAATISDVTGFLVAPVVAFGSVGAAALIDDAGDQLLTDGLIILESAILTSNVTNLVKGIVGRQRPFAHFAPPSDFTRTRSPQENNLSFFSGHSSFTMSLAVSAGTVASLRGYRLAPAIWTAGVGLSLTTGYLRIAADRHWGTDVVTGWIVGAAIGFAVPYYLHRRSTPAAEQRAPDPTAPRTVELSFTW